MSFTEAIRLNSRVTLQQMLQREDFKERIEQQIALAGAVQSRLLPALQRCAEVLREKADAWQEIWIATEDGREDDVRAAIEPLLPADAEVVTGEATSSPANISPGILHATC